MQADLATSSPMTTPGPVGFDLDMTLIDSRPQILSSFRALSDETGVAIDLEVVEARLGLKLEDELEHWFTSTAVTNAAATYRRHYVTLAATETVALPGAHEALRAVRVAGASSVIVTAKHESSVQPCLRCAGLEADAVYCFVHGPEKAEVLRRIGARVYVGDTPPDMTAGHSAGAFAVGVTTGSFDERELLDAGASVTIGSLEEFPACYRRWLASSSIP